MESAGLIVGAFFIGIAAILVLITLHELGHFIIAKMCNAYVYEFSIGYGPRIWTHKGKETWFSIRLFPLGGYCSIASDRSEPPKGREEDAEKVPDDRKMDYIARWKKALFILGGPAMNFAIAIIMISIIFMACLKLPTDMTFNGNALNKDKIAYQLVDKSLNTFSKDKNYNISQNTIDRFKDNSQSISITGWEVIQTKSKDAAAYNSDSTKTLWNDSIKPNSDVKLIYSNLLKDVDGKDQWTSQSEVNEFTRYIKDTNKFGSFNWLINPLEADKTYLAPDYSTIVYNFLDNFKCDEMVEQQGFHSYIRLSYRIMNKSLYTGEYQDTKDLVTDFGDSFKDASGKTQSFKLDKKNTTQVGVNPPARYFKNTTKAYAYSWHVMGQDSVSILKAFGLLFSGNMNALSGPIGVANQTAKLITAPETFFLYVAGLSANLMILNLIPVPPLDGYKFVENIIEAILKRELKQKTKYWLYGIGIAVFIIIYVIVIVSDLAHLR